MKSKGARRAHDRAAFLEDKHKIMNHFSKGNCARTNRARKMGLHSLERSFKELSLRMLQYTTTAQERTENSHEKKEKILSRIQPP